MADKKKKEIVAVSRGTYKGMTIYETPKGFAVLLGMLVYVSNALSSITAFIDNWFELRKNLKKARSGCSNERKGKHHV